MTFEEYHKATEALEQLRDHATEIAQRWGDRRAEWSSFTPDEVNFEVYYSGCGSEYGSFPSAWLFMDDWERAVDDAIEARKRANEAKKARLEAEAQEKAVRAEREQYERLKAKYGALE